MTAYSRVQATDLVPAAAAEVYSAIMDARCTTSVVATVNFLWYKADTTFISRTRGGNVTVTGDVWQSLACTNKTAPALTAFFSLEVEVQGDVGESVRLRRPAAAQASDIQWSEGGLSADVRFALERRATVNDPWYTVGGYSRESPLASDDPVSPRVTVYDRTSPLGLSGVQYRVIAIGVTDDGFVYSSPTVVTASGVFGAHWWLRDPDDPASDMEIEQFDKSVSEEIPGDVHLPLGREYPVVIHTSEPTKVGFNVASITFDRDEWVNIRDLLTRRKALIVQEAIGGHVWFVDVLGSIKHDQEIAAPVDGDPNSARHFMRVTAPVIVVEGDAPLDS